MGKVKVVVCMFGGYHSVLPALFCKIFNKPSVLIPGGTDCVKYPGLSYGNHSRKALGIATCLSFKLSKYIAPVSSTLAYYRNLYSDLGQVEQGYKVFCKNISAKTFVINNGYDSDKWFFKGIKEDKTFITVAFKAGTDNKNTLKGIDLIMQASSLFPDCKFIIVGCVKKFIDAPKPQNVHTVAFADKDMLQMLYSQSCYYLQLSVSEGFPNALCEAMLCECIPIVSNISSMPEIIGNTGYILEKRSIGLLQELIKKILAAKDRDKGIMARERIKALYTEQKRANELLELLDKI